MNTNKILVAGLIGGVVAFFLGWLFFGILFPDLLKIPLEGFMKPEAEMVMWAMIAANLLWGLFLAYIFVQWANISTWISGAKAGATVGFFISAIFDTGYYAMSNMFTLNSMLIDIVVNTLFAGLTGAVIGWWLGRK
ncbi:MAG TPA: hypothetical protein PK047_12570 [Saprospiraceae bacterium]|nr:hypothetical protein [Saprospiraceae bacterium]HRO09691.1 hypothetical protein [Saprospiraceae bacterium]HRP43107.1 hypothetical protein [Saprospiraceae bacterium]